MNTVEWDSTQWSKKSYRTLPNEWKKFNEIQLMELIEIISSSPNYQRATGMPRNAYWIEHASNLYKHIYLDKRFNFDKIEANELLGNREKWGKMSWCGTCRKSVYDDLIRFAEKVKRRNGL